MRRNQSEESTLTEVARTMRAGTTPTSSPTPAPTAAPSLASAAGNRAFTGLVQRWRDEQAHPSGDGPPAATTGHGPTLQRTFTHQGRQKTPATYGPGSELPKIFGFAKEHTDQLRKLADDATVYGQIEDKQGLATAWTTYQQNHPVAAKVLPSLATSLPGHITVRAQDSIAGAGYGFAGTINLIFQLDWEHSKHDPTFTKTNSDNKQNRSGKGGNQMSLTQAQYRELAGGVPTTIALQKMTDLFARAERTAFNFSVQKVRQTDGLQYEISAQWASTGPASRDVLVYYHCYPERA